MTGLFDHWYYLLIVLVIVLIIWGPGKMPDVGAGLGRAIREFRKASSETQDAFRSATGPQSPHESPAQPPAQPVSLQAPPATAPDEPRTSDTPQQQTPVSN